jgi:hypothetical protein
MPVKIGAEEYDMERIENEVKTKAEILTQILNLVQELKERFYREEIIERKKILPAEEVPERKPYGGLPIVIMKPRNGKQVALLRMGEELNAELKLANELRELAQKFATLTYNESLYFYKTAYKP